MQIQLKIELIIILYNRFINFLYYYIKIKIFLPFPFYYTLYTLQNQFQYIISSLIQILLSLTMIQQLKPNNDKLKSLNIIQNSWYLKYYFIILICIFKICFTNGIQLGRKLTNSSNKHTAAVTVIKLSQDYRSVYSIQARTASIMKIWDFNITHLELRQTIYISYNTRWHFAQTIFQWNNGNKLFVGTTFVQIYTLNSSSNLYITPPTFTPYIDNSVYTIWVNTPGDKMYVGTENGCKILDFISPNWVISFPSYLSIYGTHTFTYITLVNNQQKLIIFNWSQGKIIILKQNGTIYSPHQTIITGLNTLLDRRNCYISSNQLYICCYGNGNTNTLNQFHCYKLNPSTNLYQNITQPNTIPTYTHYSYIDKNQIYTITQINSLLVYKYQFTNSSGFYQYSFIQSYDLNGQKPMRITYQKDNSSFQLISTEQGNIFIITPKCLQRIQLYDCLTCYPAPSICHECKANFNLVSGTCVCQFPFKQVSGSCDNFTDRGLLNCINAQKLTNGTIICLLCSITSNQVVFNNLCICKAGFHDPNSTGTCTDICGDGLIFQNQCDDSNTIPGDGCNQFCQIQPGSNCSIINGQTVCKSQSLLRYAQPVEISRDKISNKAILKLKVLNSKNLLPFQIKKSDFIPQNNYISLFVSNNQSASQVHIEKLSLLDVDQDFTMYIQFQFIQNFLLEGSSARIELNYQNSKYYNYTQTIQFLMKGSNMPLNWSQNLNSYKNIAIFNLLIIIFSIFILLAGLFTPKFIGLEMILTLQLIFFSQFLIQNTSNWPLGFSFLQNLKFSTGYNDILHLSTIFSSRTTQIKFSNLNIKKHVIQNLNISFLVIFLVIYIQLFFLFYRFFYQKKIILLKQTYRNRSNTKQKQEILSKVEQFQTKAQKISFWIDKFYNTVSQLSFWTILPFFSMLSAYLLIKDNHVEFKEGSIGQNVVRRTGIFIIFFVFTSFIFVCLNNFANIWIATKKWIESQKRKKQQILYKRSLFIYLILMSYLIFFFNDSLFLLSLPTSLIALLFQILFILLLVIINPYRQSLKVHTIGLFINHLVYTLFLAIINMINFVQNLDQIIILMFGYLIVLSSLITIILSIIRLYYQYRYGQILEEKIQKERQQQEAKQKLMEKQKLQKKINKLERQKKNQLGQKERQRAENGYLYENQKQQQEKLQLLNWLKKKNWTQDMKQQYYYKNYTEKPLSWLKIHDLIKYQKKLQESNSINTPKIQKSLQKLQNKQKQSYEPQYSNLLKSIKKSHQRQIKNLQKQQKQHNLSMLQNPGYNMKIMQQNLQKFIRQQYELKD